jgi:hypothetical protein
VRNRPLGWSVAQRRGQRPDAGGSAIAMGGGPFVPMLNKAVTREALSDRQPLVFINACRSLGAVPEYTRIIRRQGPVPGLVCTTDSIRRLPRLTPHRQMQCGPA